MNLRFIFIFALTIFSFSSFANDDYFVGVGDTIQVSVYGEADLKRQSKIGKSGQFDFPFINDINVIGLTTKQIENLIDEGLRGDYLINPQINVSIISYRPFFIHGEVKRPGGYPYQIDITLDKAIALAGGLTDRASGDRWTIQRKVKGNSTEVNATLATMIMPDDIIKIEKSFF